MKLRSTILSFVVMLFAFFQVQGQNSWENRDEIPDEYKWNLNDIYDNWDDWQKGFEELSGLMDKIKEFKGRLSEGPETLLEVQQISEKMGMLSYKVYRYPQLHYDLDTREQEYLQKMQQVGILFAQFNTAVSWIEPEMLEIPWEKMEKWLNDTPGLKPYKFEIEDLYRQQAHVLDEEKETLLSYFSRFNGTPSSIYSSLSTTDIEFPEVELSDGEKIKATSGNYSLVLATNDSQADREKIFRAHYETYSKNLNTYAAIYNSVVQRNWAGAQARGYESCLQSALDGNNIPLDVYKNLVDIVKKNTEPLQKYHKLRKKIMGLEKYFGYDSSIPIADWKETYDYDDARKMIVESVAPLGEVYQEKLEKAASGGWIDVFETPGKRAGAYSGNVYGVHPYMLLNYNGTLRSVFTTAHELGHTMHTILANENQPYATSSYTIFVAEVASTFNERLLLDYMLEKSSDPRERVALLEQSIKAITGTFFFQALLADFEIQLHEMVEQGRPVTADILSSTMGQLYDAYYGDSQEKEELYHDVWTRIGHIYRTPFYVYQYATCFASSAKLYNDIKKLEGSEKEKAIESYLGLLKSGGNDYPMNQLKKAGVDLTDPATFQYVIDQFSAMVDQLEVEVNKL